MLTQRIGVIGCGTMGAAILRGLLEARVATAGRLRVVGLSLAVMCLGGAVLNNAIRFRQAAQMAHTLTAQPTPQSPEPVNLEPSS